MTSSWSNQFDDLKHQFVARSRERLSVIETLLQRLQAAPGDMALLTQTMQHFHWLAGSGGTYGFDDITSWGTYGEELCDYLLKLQNPVSVEDMDKLVTALRTVEQLFAAQAPAQTVVAPVQNTGYLEQQAAANQGYAAAPAQNTQVGQSGVSTNSGSYSTQPRQGALSSSLFSTASLSSGTKGLAAPPNNQATTSPYGSQTDNTPKPNAFGGPQSDPNLRGNASFGSSDTNPRASAPYGNPPADTNPRGNAPYNSPPDTTPAGAPPYGNPPSGNQGFGNQSASSPYAGPPITNAPAPYVNQSETIAGAPPFGNAPAGGPGYANPPDTAGGAPAFGKQSNSAPYGTETRNPNYSQTDTNPRGSSPFGAAQAFPDSGEGTRLLGGGASPTQASRSFIDDTSRPVGPAARPGPAPTLETRRSSRLSHIPTDKKFAIFVDSNLPNLAPIKTLLEERGIIVEGVTTASEAKGLFAERLPDVFIVGAPLIDNNGYELVEYMRGLETGHKPIVLVLAQQAVFLDKVYAIRSGADAFFEYPSELTDLTDKLNTLLDRDKNESYKILSVDDDPDMADFIKLTLQSAGYTVMHISDPKTFEDTFLSFEPDLVLLDIVLGEMTGFEIAKYIRQNDRFAPMPIVFLTTQNKLHQHIRSAIAGGDEHLIKPVVPQLLIATIASRLERARSLKRLIERDGLTRCLNYGSFMERAQKLANTEGSFRSAPAMMMIDVDNMKKINERMGFAAGDRIISNIANMLLKGFRNTDLIARFSNDQFAIVLEHLNPQQLQSLSSQVLGAISGTPQLVKGRSVSVTCSGGVAILEQGMSVQDWQDAAQDSLRKAKDAGGNRAIVRPPSKSTQ